MKRFWIGFVLFVMLLSVSLWTAHWMPRTHRELAQELESAAEFSLSGQREAAISNADSAWQAWRMGRNTAAILCDHGFLEQIDAGFASLHAAAACHEDAEFTALCAELACQLRAIGEAHSGKIWNFL